MAKTKISKVAKDLNVALPTVIDFLRKKDITVDENPNTRIEDDVVQLLMEAFSKDKDQKRQSDNFTNTRQSSRAKAVKEPAKEEPATTDDGLTRINRPVFVGKIDLDKKGNPVSPMRPNEAGKTEKTETVEAHTPVQAETAVEAVETAIPEPAPAKEEEAMPVVPAQEEAKAETSAGVKETEHMEDIPAKQEEPKTEPAKEEPAPEPVKEVKAEEEPAVKPEEAPAQQEEQIFHMAVPKIGPSINVVGKIDLDSINQSTRPKKKTKEERRNERISREHQGQAGTSADRKKRKRISGKEKIDIEKTAQQTSANGRSGNTAN